MQQHTRIHILLPFALTLGLTALACNLSASVDAEATLNAAVSQTVLAEVTAGIQPTDTPQPPPSATAVPPINVTLQFSTDTPQPAPTATATPADLVRPNNSDVHALRLLAAPAIDGDLSEWGTLPNVINQNVYRPANWAGAHDTSATYFIGWDESYLYIAIHVVDDHRIQTQQDAQIFKGDSIELLLDVDLAGDYTDIRLSADDYQLGLSPGDLDGGTAAKQAYLWYPVGRAGIPPDVKLSALSAADGYTLEAAVPWSLFGVSPGAVNRFGFALSVSDNDSAINADQESMVSSVSTRRLTNPTTWGTLILDP